MALTVDIIDDYTGMEYVTNYFKKNELPVKESDATGSLRNTVDNNRVAFVCRYLRLYFAQTWVK